MDANHLSRFGEWFDVLAVTHGKHFQSEDLKARTRAEYFDVLRPYPVEAVATSYEQLRRKMKKWPVPADWLEALPAMHSAGRLPLATLDEAQAWEEAQRLRFEMAEYCACAACGAANATHLKPRHVPLKDRDGVALKRRHPQHPTEIVELGFWLHGEPLKAWYAARARFYEAVAALEPEGGRKVGTRDQRLVQLATVAASALRMVK